MFDADGGRFTYAYDAVGRLASLHNPKQERTTYGYDAAAQKTAIWLANQSRTSHTFDAAGRKTMVHNLDSNDTTLSRFDYQYDGVGNRLSVAEDGGDRVTWTYDRSYQLRREHRSGVSGYDVTHAYDAVGNRLLQVEGAARTTFAYDAANQITSKVDFAGITTYSHDADRPLSEVGVWMLRYRRHAKP